MQHTWLLIVYKNVVFRGEYSAVRLQLVFSCSGFWMQPLLASLQFPIKTVWLIILTLRNTSVSLVYSFGKCKGDREPGFCLPWPDHLQSRSRISLGTLPEDTSILQYSLGMLELLYLLCSTAVALCSLEEHLKSKSTSVVCEKLYLSSVQAKCFGFSSLQLQKGILCGLYWLYQLSVFISL